MAAAISLRSDTRYVLTDEGREDLLRAPRCECNQLWISDGCYQCNVCGTIYGVVFGMTITPRRIQPKVHGR